MLLNLKEVTVRGMWVKFGDKVGHQESHCFILWDNLNKTYKNDKVPSFTLSTHTASTRLTSLQKNSWLLDIGASHHLVFDASNAPHSNFYIGNEVVFVGNSNGTLGLYILIFLLLLLLKTKITLLFLLLVRHNCFVIIVTFLNHINCLS